MKKKYYLEVIRILAILMVMYNHSAAFMSFSNQSGVEYAISFLFSMVCKGAVPLFFMVSGALLLGKNESGKDLFQKRILRMILVIVIFSFLYYMKLVLKGERPFAPFSFLLSLPTDLVYSAVLVFIQLSRCAYDFADPAPTGTEYVEKYLLVSDHFTDIAGLPETDSMGIMGIRTLRLL